MIVSWMALCAWAMGSAAPDNGAMAVRYLQQEKVLEILHGAVEPLSACFAPDASPAEATLTLVIGRDGTVAGVTVEPGDALPAPCLEEVATALQFPAHDEPRETWRWIVAWRHGAVQPHPIARRVTRPAGPLLVLLPPNPSPALEQLLTPAPAKQGATQE